MPEFDAKTFDQILEEDAGRDISTKEGQDALLADLEAVYGEIPEGLREFILGEDDED